MSGNKVAASENKVKSFAKTLVTGRSTCTFASTALVVCKVS